MCFSFFLLGRFCILVVLQGYDIMVTIYTGFDGLITVNTEEVNNLLSAL